MTKPLTYLAFCLSVTLAWGAAEVGKPAPPFTATDINGKAHSLSDYQGRIVVLEAFNPDCPFCANHYQTGAMQELQAEAARRGAVWLLVNSTARNSPGYRPPAQAQKEFAQRKIKASAWIDDNHGKLGKLYGMKSTPHMFVIDPKGILVYEGAIDDRPEADGDPRQAKNYVRAAIKSIERGQPVEVARTKSYGCGVKYGN